VLDIRNLESESSSDELQWPEKEVVKLDTVAKFCIPLHKGPYFE